MWLPISLPCRTELWSCDSACRVLIKVMSMLCLWTAKVNSTTPRLLLAHKYPLRNGNVRKGLQCMTYVMEKCLVHIDAILPFRSKSTAKEGGRSQRL